MEFKVKSTLEYEIKGACTLIFGIQALNTRSQHVLEESLQLEPSSVQHDQFVIGTGRDAADAAVVSIFGNARSTAISVHCEVVTPGFKPLHAADLVRKGVCLERGT
jgi:hypothetical protein